MNLRVLFIAASCTLVAAACETNQISAPRHASAASRNTTATAPDAAPQFLTIFPSFYPTGGFSASPFATISPASAASFDRTFHLSSSNPELTPNLPATITLPAGDDRVTVGISVPTVSSETPVTITASGAGVSVSAVLTLAPPGASLPAPIVDTIFATPLTVAAGSPSTATIKLIAPAPAGGLVVALSENLPLSATMPAAVFFPEGATIETVPIQTYVGFPNSTTTVRIEAYAGTSLEHNGINVVTGDVTEPLMIGMATLNAPIVNGFATVTGGSAVSASISLTGPAPTGGALVTLVSTDPTVATVPASVLIPAGATAANFTVTTNVVSTASSSNIGGEYAGGTTVTTLRVNPPSTPTPTPTPTPTTLSAPSLVSPSADARFAAHSTVTFDWSDVGGASSYTIQISDNDKFQSTIVSQTVTASQFTTSTLPTKRLWWRVRANSSSGASSTFTSARRFELK